MRILFVVRSLGYGGASKQLAMTANALAEKGHEVAVYSYNWNELQQDLDDSVKYIPEKDVCSNSIIEYIKTPLRIRREIKGFRPDVVVSWRTNAGCFVVISSIMTGAKVVFSERTDPYTETSVALRIATWFCGFSDGGVFQTKMAMEYYKRLVPKSIVIPNPFNLNQVVKDIIPISQRKKEIAFVGRMAIIQKRQDIMLKAFDLIHAQLPDYKLVFYGGDFDLEKVKKMAADLHLGDAVVFKGPVRNVIEHLCSSRLMVLTSDYEGIPNVVLESFAAGTPVVSTDCSPGGVRVLLDDGVNGYIVPCRDVEAIAARSIELIKDDQLSERFVAASLEKIKEFEPKKIFDAWEKYLISICY